ncbi:MAG: hypothetical protein C0524_15030 [Rhodobacter sp.]|nr:hypothetical protein [Rhodobacter sp.]
MGQGVAVKAMIRLTAGIVALALLGACGSEKAEPSPIGRAVGNIAKATVSRVKARRSGAVAATPAPVTRADLEKFGLPILRAVIKVRGADAFLTMSDAKDNVVTWATTDGTTFTLRDGILIQTRGLGPDLMSAQVPSLGALLTNGGTYQRIYYQLGDNDQTTRRTYDCTVSVVGKETIEIFSRAHSVTRISEECVRPKESITNDYWVEGSVIRKSRQLASAGTGFIEFERVVD